MVAGEGNVSLLLSSWGVEGVDLSDLDFVECLASLLDHFLASSLVHDEYKSVVVLNCLDGGLTAQWVLDNSELVEGVVNLDGLDHDLWDSLLDSGLWSMESRGSPDLCFLSGMSTFLHSG